MLIAGGGVAGLEAALALQALAGDRVELELLSPADRFSYKPMLVAEPFGSGAATDFELAPILEAAAARHRRGALAEVEADERIAVTAEGERIGYEVLLVALGAQPSGGRSGSAQLRRQGGASAGSQSCSPHSVVAGPDGLRSWSHRRPPGRSPPTSWPC